MFGLFGEEPRGFIPRTWPPSKTWQLRGEQAELIRWNQAARAIDFSSPALRQVVSPGWRDQPLLQRRRPPRPADGKALVYISTETSGKTYSFSDAAHRSHAHGGDLSKPWRPEGSDRVLIYVP